MSFLFTFLPNPHHTCQHSSAILTGFWTTTPLAAALITQTPMRTRQHAKRYHLGNADRKIHWCHHADLSTYSPYHQRNLLGNAQWPTEDMCSPAPYKHTFKELTTSSDTIPDTFIAPLNGHPTCRRGTSAVGDDKVVCKGANLVSRHWQKANYGSRRVPTLPSSNQHKTTGAI